MSWSGGAFGERARCVLAPNANMMTLDGTNTWVLREPGGEPLGGGRPRSPRRVTPRRRSQSRPATSAVVLLTHHHLDHSEAAKEFAERMGCGVRALDPEYRLGSEGLGDGDVVEVDGLEVHVVATPGHTADSLSFVLPAEAAVLTGDTVLGRGTTVVAHPDGQLGAYLDSLDRLHALAESREIGTIWPGHGPVIDEALKALDYYVSHRAERLAQVESALEHLRRATAPRGPGRRRAATPGGRDGLLRRRPCSLGRGRALRPCPAGVPGAPRLSRYHTSPGPRPQTAIANTAPPLPGYLLACARQVGDGSVRGAAGRGVGGRLPVDPRRPQPQLRQGLRRQGRLERERLAQRRGKRLGERVRDAQRPAPSCRSPAPSRPRRSTTSPR